LFSAELPWCCFCAEIKVLGLEQNFVRIFYSINKNFSSQEPPEGSTWVGTDYKYRGSIVVLSISKSVKPNEEQKEMTSGFQQGNVCKH
jgi:hypothetical protein